MLTLIAQVAAAIAFMMDPHDDPQAFVDAVMACPVAIVSTDFIGCETIAGEDDASYAGIDGTLTIVVGP